MKHQAETAQSKNITRSAKGKAAQLVTEEPDALHIITEQPAGDNGEEIDYTQPENYSVQKYVSHKVSQKKNTGGFELLTRWKGFGESDDTYEPLLNQLEDNPAIVKSYIMTIEKNEAEKILAVVKDVAPILPKSIVQMFV
jgi:hypothetical protein